VAVIFGCLAIIGTVLNKILPGESSPLLIDLPPIRMPRLVNIMRKTGSRSMSFMKEAFPWFLAGSLIVAVMQVTGLLTLWQNAIAPLTTGWMHLPKEAANAFVMGMVRRDFGAAGFASMQLTPAQTLVSLISITLFVPCIASVSILFKERGGREAGLIWFGSWIASFLVGGIVAQFLVR
jgi:ferrous iron transport protein B